MCTFLLQQIKKAWSAGNRMKKQLQKQVLQEAKMNENSISNVCGNDCGNLLKINSLCSLFYYLCIRCFHLSKSLIQINLNF